MKGSTSFYLQITKTTLSVLFSAAPNLNFNLCEFVVCSLSGKKTGRKIYKLLISSAVWPGSIFLCCLVQCKKRGEEGREEEKTREEEGAERRGNKGGE